MKLMYLSELELMGLRDVQLLEAYDQIRSCLSYYNAAEGIDTMNRERDKRLKCRAKYEVIRKLVNDRKLTPNPGNFLI